MRRFLKFSEVLMVGLIVPITILFFFKPSSAYFSIFFHFRSLLCKLFRSLLHGKER